MKITYNCQNSNQSRREFVVVISTIISPKKRYRIVVVISTLPWPKISYCSEMRLFWHIFKQCQKGVSTMILAASRRQFSGITLLCQFFCSNVNHVTWTARFTFHASTYCMADEDGQFGVGKKILLRSLKQQSCHVCAKWLLSSPYFFPKTTMVSISSVI